MANGGKKTPPESGGGPYRTPLMVSRLPGNQMLQPALRFAETALEHFAQIEPGGVDDDRVRRGTQRRDRAIRIVLVPAPLLGEDVVERHPQAPLGQLRMPALGARAVGGGQEELHLGVWKDHGADVAPLEDAAAGRGAPQLALQLPELPADHGPRPADRGSAAHPRRPHRARALLP